MRIILKVKRNRNNKYIAVDKDNNTFSFNHNNKLEINSYLLIELINYKENIGMIQIKEFNLNKLEIINNKFMLNNKVVKSDKFIISKEIQLEKKIRDKVEELNYLIQNACDSARQCNIYQHEIDQLLAGNKQYIEML